MTPEAALAAIAAAGDAGRAAQASAYHKVARPYLGTPVPVLDALARDWRQGLALDDRLALAAGLWDSNVHEGRVAAAKLLLQARIRPDAGAWALVEAWVPQVDAWAIADHVCIAGAKRVVADPARIDAVERWVAAPQMWTRRAALVITLPWTRQNHPTAQDLAIRDRVLGWCAAMAADRDWFIQKAIAWWLRDLARHDAARVQGFLDAHGDRLKAFARKEAARHLPTG